MSAAKKTICENRKERWEVEYVVMVGRVERELTLPWLVSLEARALL